MRADVLQAPHVEGSPIGLSLAPAHPLFLGRLGVALTINRNGNFGTSTTKEFLLLFLIKKGNRMIMV